MQLRTITFILKTTLPHNLQFGAKSLWPDAFSDTNQACRGLKN